MHGKILSLQSAVILEPTGPRTRVPHYSSLHLECVGCCSRAGSLGGGHAVWGRAGTECRDRSVAPSTRDWRRADQRRRAAERHEISTGRLPVGLSTLSDGVGPCSESPTARRAALRDGEGPPAPLWKGSATGHLVPRARRHHSRRFRLGQLVPAAGG